MGCFSGFFGLTVHILRHIIDRGHKSLFTFLFDTLSVKNKSVILRRKINLFAKLERIFFEPNKKSNFKVMSNKEFSQILSGGRVGDVEHQLGYRSTYGTENSSLGREAHRLWVL
jgi:hypothetical protein